MTRCFILTSKSRSSEDVARGTELAGNSEWPLQTPHFAGNLASTQDGTAAALCAVRARQHAIATSMKALTDEFIEREMRRSPTGVGWATRQHAEAARQAAALGAMRADRRVTVRGGGGGGGQSVYFKKGPRQRGLREENFNEAGVTKIWSNGRKVAWNEGERPREHEHKKKY